MAAAIVEGSLIGAYVIRRRIGAGGMGDFFFSRVPVAAPPQPRATIVPTAYLRPGGGGLGLVGTF